MYMPYPLMEILGVMKPNKFDNNNLRHMDRMRQMMQSPQYIAEEKIDGCHYLSIQGRFFSTHISTRTGYPTEKTAQLAHLSEVLQTINMPNIILDGEVNYPGKKSNDVIAITGSTPEVAAAKQQEIGYLYFTVFDILRDEQGNWLMDLPWKKRREILEYTVAKISKYTPYIVPNPVIYTNKQEALDEILGRGGEGIVLKDINGIYVPGKAPMWNWMKVKVEEEDDVVIMGYLPPTKEYTGNEFETWPYWEDGIPVSKHYAMNWIGSIVFGKYDENNQLVELGSCTGLTESLRKEISENRDNYLGRVIKIKAMEKTEKGAYRHPKFIMFHPDKNPQECRL